MLHHLSIFLSLQQTRGQVLPRPASLPTTPMMTFGRCRRVYACRGSVPYPDAWKQCHAGEAPILFLSISLLTVSLSPFSLFRVSYSSLSIYVSSLSLSLSPSIPTSLPFLSLSFILTIHPYIYPSLTSINMTYLSHL